MPAPTSFETAFLTTRTAQPEDIDELGHVNNAAYVRWVQDAAVHHWYSVMGDAGIAAEVVWIALRHEIDYRDPVLPGEEAEIRTWLGEARGPRFLRHVDIRKAGSARFSARAVTTWAMIDRETRRPRRIPAKVFEAFGLPGDWGTAP